MVTKTLRRGHGAVRGKRRKIRNTKNFIREWRIFRGYVSQGDFARECGVTRATVSRVENGKLQWTQWHLETMAAILNCQPGDLISVDPNKIGTIFEIYNRIPPARRDQAAAVLETFTDKSK